MKRGEAAITGIFPGKLEGAKCYLCARSKVLPMSPVAQRG